MPLRYRQDCEYTGFGDCETSTRLRIVEVPSHPWTDLVAAQFFDARYLDFRLPSPCRSVVRLIAEFGCATEGSF